MAPKAAKVEEPPIDQPEDLYAGGTSTGVDVFDDSVPPAETNGAPVRQTRTVTLELREEFAEQPEDWTHETLADRIEEAYSLLRAHDMISGVESKKVRQRMRHAFYGPLVI